MADVMSEIMEPEGDLAVQPAIDLANELPDEPIAGSIASQPDPQDEMALLQDWTKKPEAIVFLAFLALFVIWQTYLDLTNEANADTFLSNRALARRLGVSYSTISRRREREDFTDWSRHLDPDGVGWLYSDRKFLPIYPLA